VSLVRCLQVDYIFNSVRDFSVLKDGKAYSGKVASYIPQLARVSITRPELQPPSPL
jgi:glutaminase